MAKGDDDVNFFSSCQNCDASTIFLHRTVSTVTEYIYIRIPLNFTFNFNTLTHTENYMGIPTNVFSYTKFHNKKKDPIRAAYKVT